MEKELKISNATKNNWARLNVEESEITKKLSRRANKLYSTKNIIPVEYFKKRDNIIILNNLLLYVNEKKMDISTIIYNFGLNLLIQNNLIRCENKKITSSNKYLLEVLDEFKNEPINDELLKTELPKDETDILGIIYQSLLKEGKKNEKGSYYTPHKIIKKIIDNVDNNTTYLDPCCGTGSFLLAFADKIDNPENLYGVDSDKIACFISKINLIIKFKGQIFRPKIYNKDFLFIDNCSELSKKKFDVIATNPPWGAMNSKNYSEVFSEVTSNESFSYFIVQSQNFLKKEGRCSFILPESILNVSLHSDIREFILNNLRIKKIEMLGKAFSSVLSDVVLLDMTRENLNLPTKIITKNDKYRVASDFYKRNKNYNFSLLDEKDVKILDKIFSKKYNTLSESVWGLGVVTGNNSKHITKTKKANSEKIFTGKEVSQYFIKDSENYIVFDRKNFQQVAPDEIYRAKEKLIYKFISKKPVFAYDNKQQLVLNSANILIPNIETHSTKTVLAFLNSTLFHYIYKKKFNELKMLQVNLLQLPFPIIDEKTRLELEKGVNDYLKTSDKNDREKIENIVFKLFSLTNQEIKRIKKECDEQSSR